MNINSISKDVILKHTTCNDIYLKFLGLSDFPKGNISSPFSTDKRPSFKVYQNNGTFKCNSTGKQGDVWQFVAYLNNLDCKTNFKEVLEIIAHQMNIAVQNYHLPFAVYQNTTTPKSSAMVRVLNNKLSENNKHLEEEKTPSKLTVTIREFTELDLSYWSKLGVDKSLLEKYKLHSISSYCWTDKKPIYTKGQSVSFAFELNGNFKLYIPNQPQIGIKKNVLPPFPNGIFGLKQLGSEKLENLIICAGEKDTIVASSRGFNAVTFGSEAIHPKEELIKQLQLRCVNLFVCYDNDKTGENGRDNLVKRFSKIIPLRLPLKEKVKGYDITDYFQDHTSNDFQKIIDLALKNKNVVPTPNESQVTTIIHITENYLNQNYDIRHNIIANEIEVSPKDENQWSPCNENTLWIEMQKKNIKVPASTLEKILKSNFVAKFNPLINYFDSLPLWDAKIDYIKQYTHYITLAKDEDRQQFEYHFKKWCVRAVKCATIDGYFNKNAFVLSDDGKGQNIGKTTWIRYLCPDILSDYIVENMPKDEKDAKILLTQNFLINLDELASLTKQEINTLKSLFSADKIKVRFPYDKKDTIVRRVGSFIGSTNMSTFLQDETGSVRWLCFVVDKICFDYKKEFDINNLWSQAYYLSKDGSFDETITSEDMQLNEIRNTKFQISSPEKDLINKYLEIPQNVEETEYMYATEIQKYLQELAYNVPLHSNALGKALKSLKFVNVRNSKGNVYAVKKKI
ncbi:MAG: DUF3874 domain-containing protein [Flavobacteriales bacterium]|nr:DUF3874 domain-containing protein [Flavobacteriales bacterium]